MQTTMQTRDSGAIVREMFERFDRRDIPGVLACFADDAKIELLGAPYVPFAGCYVGPEGMKEFIGRFTGACDLEEVRHDEIHTAGDVVTVVGYERCRSKATGRVYETPIVETFRVRDGKIAGFLCAFDTAAVAEAFGTKERTVDVPARTPEITA